MSILGDLRADMLSQIGVNHTDIGTTPDIPTAQLARIMTDINGVGQWLFSNGPASWWSEGPRGDRLKAPTILSGLTLTADSRTFSGGSMAAWMHGCTVQVGGQSEWNRIFQTGASTWELLIPSSASVSGSGTMTVYHDCLNLDSTSVGVGRVILDNQWELLPMNAATNLEVPRWNIFVASPITPRLSWGPWGRERQVDVPRNYALDNTQLYGGAYIVQLRVNPLPNTSYALHWLQREAFSPITAWSDARTTIIPHNYEDSVLKPLLRERMVKYPNFEGDKERVMAEAAEAREIMQALDRPQDHKDLRFSTAGVY